MAPLLSWSSRSQVLPKAGVRVRARVRARVRVRVTVRVRVRVRGGGILRSSACTLARL